MKKVVLSILLFMFCAVVAYAAKSKTTSQSLEVNASADKIWAVLREVNSWSRNNPAVKMSRLVSGDGESVGSVIEFEPVLGNKSPKLTLTVITSEKNHKIEYTAKVLGVTVKMGFEIIETPTGCTLTSYETATGLIVSALAQNDIDETHRLWAEWVKNKVEGK